VGQELTADRGENMDRSGPRTLAGGGLGRKARLVPAYARGSVAPSSSRTEGYFNTMT